MGSAEAMANGVVEEAGRTDEEIRKVRGKNIVKIDDLKLCLRKTFQTKRQQNCILRLCYVLLFLELYKAKTVLNFI